MPKRVRTKARQGEVKPCAVCGLDFTVKGNRKVACSPKCTRIFVNEQAKAIMKKKHSDRWVHYWFRDCVVCGKRFVTTRRSICCSPECGKYRKNLRLVEQHGADTAKVITCPECGKVERYALGKHLRIFCSSVCGQKYHKRIANQKRRAAKRGAFVESVDPIEVFRRDGYQCHLCGCKVDMARMGQHTGNAPELDHIVPLSRGGKHSYSNVACSCSACNNKKKDKLLTLHKIMSLDSGVIIAAHG